jgi:hypothetical protein
MKNEARIVRAMLEELKATPVKTFPERGRPDAPQRQGVYIIYSPHGKSLTSGGSPASLCAMAVCCSNEMNSS